MARYRRRRFYKRKSGKWSANISELGTTTITVPQADGVWFRDFTLAFNPTQINTAVSQVYTVKNFEVTFDMSYRDDTPTSYYFIEDITAYIMYVPQGMTITANYNLQHPEYIMAYKYIGQPTSDGAISSRAQAARVKTRLCRKLQSGDSIILFIKGNHTKSEQYATQLEFSGLARWWTKAN